MKPDYGPEKWRDMDGPGLFAQMRAVCQVVLVNVKPQTPVVKFTGHTEKVKATK
jgi:hypothetical protein